MKVAYVFATDTAATYKLATMILPQLEDGSHGASVVGMFFFDDNLFCLRAGDPVGERLAKVAAEQNILLMICDRRGNLRAVRQGRGQAEGNRRRGARRLLPAALRRPGSQSAGSGHHALRA